MLIERLMKLALLGSEWVLYLLLALSVLSFATMIERLVYFWKRRGEARAIRKDIEETLSRGEVAELSKRLASRRSVEAGVVRVALHWLSAGPEALNDAVDAEGARLRSELERGTNLLGTLGNNAPFVGLFGTVLGVIIAFHALGDAGGNAGAMGGVMAGIAEALVATGVGLFVALPAVTAYNLIQKRIGEIEGDVVSLVKLITAHAKSDSRLIDQALRLREEKRNVAHLHTGDAQSKRQKEANAPSQSGIRSGREQVG